MASTHVFSDLECVEVTFHCETCGYNLDFEDTAEPLKMVPDTSIGRFTIDTSEATCPCYSYEDVDGSPVAVPNWQMKVWVYATATDT